MSVWVFPHGALCKCSDAFPGSILDEQITEQIDVIDYCPKGKVVLTDKGFAISDLRHEKGVNHDRPPMRFNTQYDDNDISLNFFVFTMKMQLAEFRIGQSQTNAGPLEELTFLEFVGLHWHRLLT